MVSSFINSLFILHSHKDMVSSYINSLFIYLHSQI